ncbi:hypothetical protein D083_1302 [Dickeya solani RNS 08.23.3.1.A]|nr:hypothetical protein D083_1302 [Dickeya solani RNS 08.23.3.1.A]
MIRLSECDPARIPELKRPMIAAATLKTLRRCSYNRVYFLKAH